MKKNKATETLDSFDKDAFKVEFDKALPQIITTVSDLLERPVPRITKRDRKEISNDIIRVLDISMPQLMTLEKISGDPQQVDQGYRILEGIIRTQLRQAKVRLLPNEDAFDCFLRKSASLLRSHYRLKRRKQFRTVREGIKELLRAAVVVPQGMKKTEELIEAFSRKHLKEYVRFANTLDTRLNSRRNVNVIRMTPGNIAWLTDLYRDTAAAFEKRLRLLVGLNFIALGDMKAYDELRGRGYGELLQIVSSPQNPLLHFLIGAVDRQVRNAMMHGSVSSSISKGVISFVDYAPRKKKETEIIWTMNEFLKRTEKLVLTAIAAMYLENEFNYLHLYCTVAAFRHLRSQAA
jgi:hypothetical protein